MKTNPGGQLSPNEVIGRDRIIAQIWRALEKQSVVLTAARRMGKTSILKKMEAQPLKNTLPVFHDLEKLRSPAQFVETVYADVEAFLTVRQKAMTQVSAFLSKLGGGEAAGVKLPKIAETHWQMLLAKIVEDLSQHRTETIVFFWDEMPMMLENIKQDHGEKTAMEVLDTLRALRQTYPQTLRMVYTGSIGLHHVFGALQQAGYTNAPINDMKQINVPPLDTKDAEGLVLLLLEGEGLVTDDLPGRLEAARVIARSVDNVAFYIHHVVDHFVLSDQAITPATIQATVRGYLRGAQDDWAMQHYRTRITNYYQRQPQQEAIALRLLDIVATASGPLTQSEAFNLLGAGMAYNAKEARNVLTLLLRDHYLIRSEDAKEAAKEQITFYLPLIGQWWRMDRGL